MARTPRPWYRQARDGWYAQVGGRQVRLADGRGGEAIAWAELARLTAASGRLTRRRDWTLGEVCELYLAHSAKAHRPMTCQCNRWRLSVAFDGLGDVQAASLGPGAIERWLAGLQVRPQTKRSLLMTLKAATAWAVREGHLESDPLAGVRLPPPGRRERTLTPDERERLRAAASPAMRDVILMLEETGCRPHLAIELEARDIDWGAGIAVRQSKRRPYTMILTERLTARLRELAERHPTGPLLRGDRKVWTMAGVMKQFESLRAKTGISGVTAYTYRHSYITDALERGVPVAQVAELVGHTSLAMIARHYSKLAERRGTLRAAAEAAARAARQRPPESATPPPASPPPTRPRAGARSRGARGGPRQPRRS